MHFSSWKEWVNKFVNNNNNKEKAEELQDPSIPFPLTTSAELLQPSQNINTGKYHLQQRHDSNALSN